MFLLVKDWREGRISNRESLRDEMQAVNWNLVKMWGIVQP
jgi:hypothetical protein